MLKTDKSPKTLESLAMAEIIQLEQKLEFCLVRLKEELEFRGSESGIFG